MTSGRCSFGLSLGIAVLLFGTMFSVPPATAEPVPGSLPGWSLPSLLTPTNLTGVIQPRVAVDSTGNATVVWFEYFEDLSPSGTVLTSRFTDGVGWSYPRHLAFAVSGGRPHLAMDPQGLVHYSAALGWDYDTIAVWHQEDSVYASVSAEGGYWSAPQVIGAACDVEAHPTVTMDVAGNALVVWEGSLPYLNGCYPGSIYASRFTPPTGWSEAIDIGTGNDPRGAHGSHEPQVAMNAKGEAVIAWVEPGASFGSSPFIAAKRFTPGDGWSPTVDLYGSSRYRADCRPDVAVDARGNAIVVWAEGEPLDFLPRRCSSGLAIHARHFSATTGWGFQHEINRTAGYLSDPQIAMGPGGNATLLWRSDGFHASHFTPGTGWGTPVPVEGGGDPQLTYDPSGKATLISSRSLFDPGHSGFQETIFATPFHPMSGWGPSEPIGSGWGYHVAVDTKGRRTVVWTDGAQVLMNRSSPAAGWGTTRRVERASFPNTGYGPQVAVDLQGNALAVWGQEGMVLARVYDPGLGWSRFLAIGVGVAPRVVMNPEGAALIIWHESYPYWSEGHRIYARQWDASGGLSPPQILGQGWVPERSLAISSGGHAVVGFWQGNGPFGGFYTSPDLRLHARVFQPSIGWGSDEVADEGLSPQGVGGTRPSENVELAIDTAGRALVVWRQISEKSQPNVATNRYLPGAGWGQAEEIDAGSGYVLSVSRADPLLAMDTSGRAIALWVQESASDGLWLHRLYARRFAPESGWGALEMLGTYDDGSPALAMNPAGDALAIWGGSARWYSPGSGWKPTESVPGWSGEASIDSRGNALRVQEGEAWHFTPEHGWRPYPLANAYAGRHTQPQVAMDGIGNGMAVWSDVDGIRAIRFVRTTTPDLDIASPVTDLTNLPRFTIGGTTNLGVAVTVNGTPVPVDDRGGFSYDVASLPDGTHTFEVLATGREGYSQRTIEVTVDTRPPILSITQPRDRETVDTSAVTIVGLTEVGAGVVVDGLVVSVAPDGSFAFKVPLAEGRNTITVTATDPAGNTVTQFLVVEYARPRGIPSLEIGIVTIGAILLVGFALLYRSVRHERTGGKGVGPFRLGGRFFLGRREEDFGSTEKRSPSGGANGRPWPPQAVSKGRPTHLTVKERVVLHLLDYAKYADAAEVPLALTQDEIASAAGFDQRHFSQYVRPLLEEGLVEERNAHVAGVLQRRKVYALSYAGWHKGLGLRKRLEETKVAVKEGPGTREVPIADILSEERGSRSLLEIVRESLEKGWVDRRH